MDRRRRTQNWILRALPRDDYIRLSQRTISVPLKRGDVLFDGGSHLGRVTFMMSGACSAVLTTASGQSIEVASISCDGVTSLIQTDADRFGIQIVVTVDHASAMQVDVVEFDAEMDRRGALRDLVTTYYRGLQGEIMMAVPCNRFHTVRARCCRKLLTLADRIGSDTVHVTHAALALMLGTTRPSVTLTATDLKRRGMIDYYRDTILLLDRFELERAACDCYHVIRDLCARREA